MPAATERIVRVLSEHGYQVEILQRAETYVRLMVTDPVSGRDTKIELVAEFLRRSPVASEWGPVLHRDDVAAGKMEALFSRAEARDFTDVDALVRAGYTRDWCTGWTRPGSTEFVHSSRTGGRNCKRDLRTGLGQKLQGPLLLL